MVGRFDEAGGGEFFFSGRPVLARGRRSSARASALSWPSSCSRRAADVGPAVGRTPDRGDLWEKSARRLGQPMPTRLELGRPAGAVEMRVPSCARLLRPGLLQTAADSGERLSPPRKTRRANLCRHAVRNWPDHDAITRLVGAVSSRTIVSAQVRPLHDTGTIASSRDHPVITFPAIAS